jgi:hypothetical protein
MHTDDALREQFARLREQERRTAPGFDALLRPRQRRRAVGVWLVTAAAAAIAMLGGVMLRNSEPRIDDIMAWRAESDALLEAAFAPTTTHDNGGLR